MLTRLLLILCGLNLVVTLAVASPFQTDEIVKVEASKIEQWGKEPILIKAVREQNAKKKTLAEIKALDKIWMNPDNDERIKTFLNNSAAARLKELKASNPAYLESFVMDNQGAIVCMTDKTSDYWQGNEDKWIKSFNDGKGQIYIDKPQYDNSTKRVLLHISVPVIDTSKTIGVLTVGVDLEVLKASQSAK
ncbi:MAG: PDC sensor domain-containing protein [Acidobacteriota bacterium]